MSNHNTQLPALVPASGGALTPSSGPQRIATRMAENLLTQACSQERALAAQRRYQIGGYEFRQADYAQIQRWARRLGMAPEAVVVGLANSQKERGGFGDADTEFRVNDGAMVSLVWDFDLFPLTNWDWGAGLGITRLDILNASNGPLPTLPKFLRELICDENELSSLSLEHVPGLQELYCWGNELTALDLTPVPGLQTLFCYDNQLTALDLTPVPRLEMLYCSNNELTTLDLTPVPGLEMLFCNDNELTELDLTPVQGLGRLDCSDNELTDLDLTPVQGLRWLNCDRKVKITNAPKKLEVSHP